MADFNAMTVNAQGLLNIPLVMLTVHFQVSVKAALHIMEQVLNVQCYIDVLMQFCVYKVAI